MRDGEIHRDTRSSTLRVIQIDAVFILPRPNHFFTSQVHFTPGKIVSRKKCQNSRLIRKCPPMCFEKSGGIIPLSVPPDGQSAEYRQHNDRDRGGGAASR